MRFVLLEFYKSLGKLEIIKCYEGKKYLNYKEYEECKKQCYYHNICKSKEIEVRRIEMVYKIPKCYRFKIENLKEMINEKTRSISVDIRYSVETRSFIIDIGFSFIDIGIRLDEELINKMSVEQIFIIVLNNIEKECRKLYLKE